VGWVGGRRPPAGDARWAAALSRAQAALAREDFAQAASNLEAALKLTPRHPDLLTNLGAALSRLGRLDEAASKLEAALAIESGHAVAARNLAATLGARGNRRLAAGALADGVADLRRALTLDPAAAETRSALGLGLAELGRLPEAIEQYRLALEGLPGHAVTLNRLGMALMTLGRFGEARGVLEQAAAAAPDMLEARVNLGAVCSELGRVTEAEAWSRQAVERHPAAPEAHNNLGLALREQGEVAAALAHFERACALQPEGFLWQSGRLLTMNYLPGIDGAALAAAHREVGAAWSRAVGQRAISPRDPDPARRLRVGYLSPDFRTHSVAYFVESFLGEHDPAAVEVIGYASSPVRDDVTDRLQALAHRWRSVSALDDGACHAQIVEDEIDVLVDLAGHTAHNRLAVFARRAAPVQMSYLGYGVTTGLPAMDYLLTDELADPDATGGSETALPLPGGYLAYRPPFGPQGGPPPGPLPARAAGHVTFGSFNNLAKVSDPTVALWSRVLDQVPGARLLIKARGLAGPEARARLHQRFAAHGIAADRLALAPATAGTPEHLALYGQVDIALDTFPYGGTTTTCEALWMGVPVVTLTGDTHMSRVGHSILARVAPEWVAHQPQHYLQLAAGLAGDLDRLESLRRELRPRLLASPLMDGRRLARALEAAYRQAWRAALARS
jgi:protein O-GlcNAc transferase